MSWKDLAATIGRHASTLGRALGGPAGGAIGGIIADVLGVEKTPEAVTEALRANPELYVRLQEIERTHEIEILRAAYEAEKLDKTTFLETYRAELQSDSWMAKNWRPFFGWAVGFSFAVQMIGITIMLLVNPQKASEILSQIDSLTVIWSVGLAVLGVNIDRRSRDKEVREIAKTGAEPVERPGIVELLTGAVSRGRARN